LAGNNYAAVEPTFLSAIDFLTNGTVNGIICDDDRINCNLLALSYRAIIEFLKHINSTDIYIIRIKVKMWVFKHVLSDWQEI
jgi:hypothetical protein